MQPRAFRRLTAPLALAALAPWTVALAQQAPAPAQAPAAAAAAPASPAEAEIRSRFDAFVQAFNDVKPEAVTAFFTDEGALIDGEGQVSRGKEAITEVYTAALSADPAPKLGAQVDTVRQLTADVAQIEGDAQITIGDVPQLSRFTALLVRKDGQWRMAELRDEPIPAPLPESNYERLKEVEWMVGDWVDESQDSRISSSIRWALSKNFLVRNYSVEVNGEKAMSGVMWLGYDPRTDQLKSWVFDSRGGYGEAHWTRTGDNQWVLKANGVMRDGSPTSATQIINLVNKDVVQQSSIDRIVGGEVAPDIAPVTMVRKPPDPNAAPAAGAPAAAPAAPAPAGAPR